jgi:hypothetical protein
MKKKRINATKKKGVKHQNIIFAILFSLWIWLFTVFKISISACVYSIIRILQNHSIWEFQADFFAGLSMGYSVPEWSDHPPHGILE